MSGLNSLSIRPIGIVSGGGEGPATIRIEPTFRDGLRGLEEFSHVVVAWWAHKADDPELRTLTDAGRPYTHLDYDLGIFATRSSLRPNPLAITVIQPLSVDVEAGIIEVPYLDAEEGTPVLDLKPYTPSIDRVANPKTPAWCAHWPSDVETSGDFDWSAEFRF